MSRRLDTSPGGPWRPGDETDDVLDKISVRVGAARTARCPRLWREGVTAEDAVDCVQEGLCALLTVAQASALPADPEEWEVCCPDGAERRAQQAEEAFPRAPARHFGMSTRGRTGRRRTPTS